MGSFWETQINERIEWCTYHLRCSPFKIWFKPQKLLDLIIPMIKKCKILVALLYLKIKEYCIEIYECFLWFLM